MPKTTLVGIVVKGVGNFEPIMTNHKTVFEEIMDTEIYPGTINVKIDRTIEIREEFRVKGAEINRSIEDFLIERCQINGEPAFRIRPYNPIDGSGGHGDDVIEITAPRKIDNVTEGNEVVITFIREC